MKGALNDAGAYTEPSRGAWIATHRGRVTLQPDTAADASAGRISGAAAVFANATAVHDLVIAPTPVGLDTYVQFREPFADGSFEWRLTLPAEYEVAGTADAGLALMAPSSDGGERQLVSTGKPVATDARGQSVPVEIQMSSGRLALVVAPTVDTTEPVVAQISWARSGPLPGDWWAYGADEPLRGSKFALLRGTKTELGCGYTESGSLEPGEVEVSRQVAALESECLSVIETGDAPSSRVSAEEGPEDAVPDEPESDAALPGEAESEPMAVAAAAPRVNRAFYKTIQEDVAQIDLNSVKPIIKWKYGNRCVRRILKRYDRTDAYGPTGWELVEHHTVKNPRTCGEGTMQTYGKFEGGQYFPACFGSKVTTIYANTIIQGLPRGRADYHTYHVTGGAPCHELLHWDSIRGNRRIR